MIPYDALRQAWQAERAHRIARYRSLPVIEDAGIVLGGQSVIARKVLDRWGAPSLAIEGEERRVLALLAVAYWRPVGSEAIHHLKRASHTLSRGDGALAALLQQQRVILCKRR